MMDQSEPDQGDITLLQLDGSAESQPNWMVLLSKTAQGNREPCHMPLRDRGSSPPTRRGAGPPPGTLAQPLAIALQMAAFERCVLITECRKAAELRLRRMTQSDPVRPVDLTQEQTLAADEPDVRLLKQTNEVVLTFAKDDPPPETRPPSRV